MNKEEQELVEIRKRQWMLETMSDLYSLLYELGLRDFGSWGEDYSAQEYVDRMRGKA